MKTIVFSSILFLAYAITEYLPRNMKLKFDISVQDKITIEFWVPEKTIAYYGWVGIGLQDSRDAMDNFECDYYIALVDGGVFDDRYTTEEVGIPTLDVELSGTVDITSSRTTEDKHEVFILTRDLVTPDIYDVPVYIGRPLVVKWSLGNLDANGEIALNDLEDMGFEYVLLDTLYEDRNHDERAKYGPWMESEDNIILPEDQRPEKEEWSEYLEDEFGRPSLSSTGEFASDELTAEDELSKTEIN